MGFDYFFQIAYAMRMSMADHDAGGTDQVSNLINLVFFVTEKSGQERYSDYPWQLFP